MDEKTKYLFLKHAVRMWVQYYVELYSYCNCILDFLLNHWRIIYTVLSVFLYIYIITVVNGIPTTVIYLSFCSGSALFFEIKACINFSFIHSFNNCYIDLHVLLVFHCVSLKNPNKNGIPTTFIL